MFRELEKWKQIDLEALKRRVILSHSTEFADMNREQLRKGITSENTSFSYKNPKGHYAQKKKNMPSYKAKFPKVDFFFTGNFQNLIYLIIKGKEVVYNSRDTKADLLQSNYGKEIFGLTKENLKKVHKITGKDLMIEISKKLR